MALVIGIAALAILAVYLEFRKERGLTQEKVEIEEYRDWAWPARKAGPQGRARL